MTIRSVLQIQSYNKCITQGRSRHKITSPAILIPEMVGTKCRYCGELGVLYSSQWGSYRAISFPEAGSMLGVRSTDFYLDPPNTAFSKKQEHENITIHSRFSFRLLTNHF